MMSTPDYADTMTPAAKLWTTGAILLAAFGALGALASLVDSGAYRLLFLPAFAAVGMPCFRVFDRALEASKTARRREAARAAARAEPSGGE